MKTKFLGWAGALALGTVGLFSPFAERATSAQKPFLDKARKLYELGPQNGKCDLCHEKKPGEEPGKKNLNLYGKAIAADADMKPLLGKDEKYKFSDDELKILEKVLVKLENEDSDKDGATNKEELMLSTNPGDPKSTPEKKALAKYRKDHPVGK